MASPIDTNPSLAALNTASNAVDNSANNSANNSLGVNRSGQVNPAGAPAFNIPNDGANYHWFLSENTGSRTLISISDSTSFGINAAMGVDDIANRVLSHLAA